VALGVAMLRRIFLVLALALASAGASRAADNSFAAFLAALWRDAQAQGITRTTFDTALAGVTPDAGVLALRQRQPEYGKPVAAYLAGMISPARIAIGQRKAAQCNDTLQAVEHKFGVEASILVSVWGIESSFGDAPDHWDVFRSLATLAQAHIQHPLFRDELLSALKILQDDHIPRQQFVGSWAGAMGQPQFLPSSFRTYAVDFDGDGRADIWNSVPDVLASIANYLHKFGWQSGLPWGFEVILPRGFDYPTAGRAAFAAWTKRGVRRADGSALPQSGEAILFFPSGAAGPAFLVTDNFIVLKRFNNSDIYALAAGELAGRLHRLPPARAAWPADDFQPSREERIALQRRLAELGNKIEDFTGHFDFELRDAVREQQKRLGMIPDGHPGRAFLRQMGIR
jgi:membrane-bound lytic murein transglycosylase B